MPTLAQSKPGRPRASGKPKGIPAVPLTHDELIPFEIGYRIGSTYPHLKHGWNGELYELGPYLTAHERRLMIGTSEPHLRKWIGIGVAYSIVRGLVQIARGE